MSYREFFARVHARQSMYGLDGSFAVAVAFIRGCDAGNDGRLLTGFREWLVTLLGRGDSLSWKGLVLNLAAAPISLEEEPEFDVEDKVAVDKLFSLLDEFFAKRENEGLTKIYDEYITWLKAQSWFDPSDLNR